MNKKAIKKLRRKFIITAMASFLGVMLLMSATIYIINVHTTMRQISKTLDYIADNGGLAAPEDAQMFNNAAPADFSHKEKSFLEDFFEDLFNTGIDSEEFLHSVRYFAVIYDTDNKPVLAITNHIARISDEQAEAYATQVLESGDESGSVEDFKYKVQHNDTNSVVVCMDVTSQMANVRRVGNIALFIMLAGTLLSYIFIRLISGRMIKPEIKAAEQQKQFITNAGHELKTPLSVIRANTELEMMMHGDDEWNKSTMNQVDRMTGLINDLVLIARSEEKEDVRELSDIDVSKTVSDVTDIFASVAAKNGKTLEKDIPDGIVMRAMEEHVRQLTSLLVDNAIKYCDDGGAVTVQLASKGKGIRISVSNNYAQGEHEDYSRFFERFYRQDKSHNIDKGGYGIGLSIADSIVRKYRGKIDVSWKDGIITFTCLLK